MRSHFDHIPAKAIFRWALESVSLWCVLWHAQTEAVVSATQWFGIEM